MTWRPASSRRSSSLSKPNQENRTSHELTAATPGAHLEIGALLYDGLDQVDLTAPFDVLSRILNSTYRIYGLTEDPVRDIQDRT
jgi:hypothetical protein